MATAANCDATGWTRQSSTPIIDGRYPLVSRSADNFPPAYTPKSTARILYVDATLGNDGTGSATDLATVVTPFEPQTSVNAYATLSGAYVQVRDGEGDWVLLKRGESFDESTLVINESGDSSTYHSLIGCYGSSGNRPVIRTGSSTGINLNGNVASYWTFYGFELYAEERDPNHVDFVDGTSSVSGIRLVGGGDEFIIDDCEISFYGTNVNVSQYGATAITDVTMKNNIFHNAWEEYGGGYSSGVFCNDVDGLTIEDNFSYINGWNPDDVNGFKYNRNHAYYLQVLNDGANLIFDRNVVLEASGQGIYARAGGQIKDNLVMRTPIGIEVGYTGYPLASDVNAVIEDNVVLEGVDMDLTDSNPLTSGAIWGIRIEDEAVDDGGTVTLTNNIVANRTDSDTDRGIKDDSAGTTQVGNVVYEWEAAQDTTDGAWPHPDAGMDEYMVSSGLGSTYADFVSQSLGRGVGETPLLLGASAINDYFRAGFNK